MGFMEKDSHKQTKEFDQGSNHQWVLDNNGVIWCHVCGAGDNHEYTICQGANIPGIKKGETQNDQTKQEISTKQKEKEQLYERMMMMIEKEELELELKQKKLDLEKRFIRKKIEQREGEKRKQKNNHSRYRDQETNFQNEIIREREEEEVDERERSREKEREGMSRVSRISPERKHEKKNQREKQERKREKKNKVEDMENPEENNNLRAVESEEWKQDNDQRENKVMELERQRQYRPLVYYQDSDQYEKKSQTWSLFGGISSPSIGKTRNGSISQREPKIGSEQALLTIFGSQQLQALNLILERFSKNTRKYV